MSASDDKTRREAHDLRNQASGAMQHLSMVRWCCTTRLVSWRQPACAARGTSTACAPPGTPRPTRTCWSSSSMRTARWAVADSNFMRHCHTIVAGTLVSGRLALTRCPASRSPRRNNAGRQCSGQLITLQPRCMCTLRHAPQTYARCVAQLAEPDPRVTRLVSDLGEGRPLGSARGWTAPPAVLVLNKV